MANPNQMTIRRMLSPKRAELDLDCARDISRLSEVASFRNAVGCVKI